MSIFLYLPSLDSQQASFTSLPLSLSSLATLFSANRMEEPSNSNTFPHASSSTSSPSSSAPSHEHQEGQQQLPPPAPLRPSISYRLNISVSNSAASAMRDEAWSCIVVLLTFWFFASMTLILGFYGSINLHLGPNCSRLIQASSLFVRDVKVRATAKPETGPVLYGFTNAPPLDVETTWSENHRNTIPVNFHQEWIYYLNKGSHITVSYSIKSEDSSPLSLVISQGKEGLIEWIEDPTYPNTTLSWNIVYGSGVIRQDISKSSEYYIAAGNINPITMEVELNFTIHAFVYNTTGAYYKCPMNHKICSLKLLIFGATAAVLATPGPQKGGEDYESWYVKLSYGPRWITYFIGSGGLTILIILACKIYSKFQNGRGDGSEFHVEESANERTPLLIPKDDDTSSWGSSYDSVSNDEEDLEDWSGAAPHEAKQVKEGENGTSRRICAVCFDSPRDCFFLPCGHCATCFACGTRIAEEANTCPICRRKMKKVRKIFAV